MTANTVLSEAPDVFRFDKVEHKYWLNALELPGTTKILKAAGVINDRWYTEKSRQRGQAVHASCHYLGEHDLNWKTVHPSIIGYVRAYEAAMKVLRFIPLICERPNYHPVYRYGSTADQVGVFRGDNEGLVELKTGTMPAWTSLQTAAQAMTFWPRTWMKCERVGLELHEDGTFRIERFTNPSDGSAFLSMLASMNWKANNI